MPDNAFEAEPRIKQREFYQVAARHFYGRGRWFAGSDPKPELLIARWEERCLAAPHPGCWWLDIPGMLRQLGVLGIRLPINGNVCAGILAEIRLHC